MNFFTSIANLTPLGLSARMLPCAVFGQSANGAVLYQKVHALMAKNDHRSRWISKFKSENSAPDIFIVDQGIRVEMSAQETYYLKINEYAYVSNE